MWTQMLKSWFVQLIREILIPNSVSISPKKTHTISRTITVMLSSHALTV